MGTGLVVRADVTAKDGLELTTWHDEDVVQALLADRPHPTFGEGVGARRLHRYEDGLGTGRGEDSVKGGHELRVAVSYEEPEAPAPVLKSGGTGSKRCGAEASAPASTGPGCTASKLGGYLRPA